MTVCLAVLLLAAAACGDDDAGSDAGGTGEVERQDLLGDWQITAYLGPDGMVAPLDGLDATLTFGDDDTLELFAGCNTGTGSWSLDGDGLSVGPIAQTLRECPEPEGVMDQEAAISQLVQNAARVEISGQELRLLGADGEVTIEATATP